MAPDGGAERKLFRMLFFEIMIDFFVSSFDFSIIRKKRFYRKNLVKPFASLRHRFQKRHGEQPVHRTRWMIDRIRQKVGGLYPIRL